MVKVANKMLEIIAVAPTTPLLDTALITDAATSAAHFAKLDSITEVNFEIVADGVIMIVASGVGVS